MNLKSNNMKQVRIHRFDAGDTTINNRKLTKGNSRTLPPELRFPLEIGGGTTNNA